MLLETYYATYLGACAILIVWLGWTLHRSGSVFLEDAFAGNRALVRAVSHLLDVGFYLFSLGYVGLTYQTYWQAMNNYGDVVRRVIVKLAGFMLLLGVAHLFNLLLLAIFRRRGSAQTGVAA